MKYSELSDSEQDNMTQEQFNWFRDNIPDLVDKLLGDESLTEQEFQKVVIGLQFMAMSTLNTMLSRIPRFDVLPLGEVISGPDNPPMH